jgi:hypothetical protein
MRALLAIVLAGCMFGCMWSSSSDGDDDDGPRPSRPTTGQACRSDNACSSGELCARTGTCLPVSQIRAVHVLWTIGGAQPDAASCTPAPDFDIGFRNSEGEGRLGYAPVPCELGKFTVDKLPTSFTLVRLTHKGKTETANVDAQTGDAVFDLTL